MPQINNILVPVELDENAVPVVMWASLVARATESRIALLHVNEALEPIKSRPALQGEGISGAAATVEQWRSASSQTAQRELAHLAERCCAGISFETVLLEGRAHGTILGYLEHTPYDLVVMGRHGKPWYQWPYLGSTAEAVLRMLSLPVLIVHNTAVPQRRPQVKKLLLSTDLSIGSKAAEEWAFYLAAHGAEEVVLVHVVENPLLNVYDPDKAEFALQQPKEKSRQRPPQLAQPFWDHAHRVAQEKLRPLQQQFLEGHVQVQLLIRDGSAAEEILMMAEQTSTDLIVIATHGTGIRRLLIGRVTERVVYGASCPVFVVPSRA